MSSEVWYGFFAGIFVGTLLIGFLLLGVMNDKIARTAIENNCGQYNSQTGEFEWKLDTK